LIRNLFFGSPLGFFWPTRTVVQASLLSVGRLLSVVAPLSEIWDWFAILARSFWRMKGVWLIWLLESMCLLLKAENDWL
jgi:hypothetical protein